jgi:dTDP-4-amino-4,6-dideoxygalactose transaminase
MVSTEPAFVIRLARPDITEADIAAVAEVLRSGQLVQGAQVAAFERAVARYTEGGDVVAVSNGTAALHLALLALGVVPGDRIGVATFSWPATANVIVLCGARPVFIDIEPVTLGMDPDALERVLQRGPGLRALLPVHAFGNMANMRVIMTLADAHGLPVIEDAACALGAVLDGRPAGSWGRMGCFSFHPRKAATTGEGGAIRTTDRELVRIARSLRNHGQDPDAATPDFITAGFNMRLTEFQAALGQSQLARYGSLLLTRRDQARRYDELLARLPLERPTALQTGSHVYQSYVVLLDGRAAERRDAIIGSLREQGIETNIGTHHMPLLTHFRRVYGHARGEFPVTDRVAASALALPLHPSLTPEDQQAVASALGRELER